MVRGLDEVKSRKVLGPVDVSSKADSTETHRIRFMQPELRPTVSQHQRPIPELQVKQAEVYSESPSFSVDPKTVQTLSMSPRDTYLQSRKRPALSSVETHYTDNPQLKDPRQAKYARSLLQPVGQCSPESALESTAVNSAVSSTLLSEQRDPSTEECKVLIEIVKHMKKNMLPGKSALDNAKTFSDNSSQSNVEKRLDSKCDNTLKENPPSTKSLKGMFSVAPPVIFGYEKQHVNPDSTSVLPANNLSLESSSTTINPFLKATKANADSTMLNSASTADSCDPQHQSSDHGQNMIQLKRSSIHSIATNPNTGQVSQPEGNTETYNTGVCQMPISSIITVRPDPIRKELLGDYERQNHTEVNRVIEVPHSVSTVSTANPSDTVAASGGCGQYSQMTYVRTGLSGSLSSEAVVGYVTPSNPPVYTESLYHSEGYTTGGLNASQIHPGQQAICLQSFGHSLATPLPMGWVNLEMHQQQQHLLLMAQQQHSSSTSTTLPAGRGNMTNDAAYTYVPFSNAANNPQRFWNIAKVYLSPSSFVLSSYNQQSHHILGIGKLSFVL